jgi:hypothetical protein
MNSKNMLIIVIAMFCFTVGTKQAQALPVFPDAQTNAFQYGDFYSYSLPVLDYFEDGGGYNASSAWYVASPGPSDDPIVIYTHANNVDDNPPGMDDAYESVRGNAVADSFFNTGTSPDPPPPHTGPPTPTDPAFAGDTAEYWDAGIGALLDGLDGGSLVFFFNNAQRNSTEVEFSQQNLFGWGQVQIVDNDDILPTLYFDFSNVNTGNDVTLYSNATRGDGGGIDPQNDYVSISNPGDFVLSGGYNCLDAGGNPVACDGSEEVRLAHNLGFNAAAYALYAPEIDMNLQNWMTAGYDLLSIDMRLRALNNGPEQLFILPDVSVYVIPEPSTFLLLGAGLLALGFLCIRRRQN